MYSPKKNSAVDITRNDILILLSDTRVANFNDSDDAIILIVEDEVVQLLGLLTFIFVLLEDIRLKEFYVAVVSTRNYDSLI